MVLNINAVKILSNFPAYLSHSLSENNMRLYWVLLKHPSTNRHRPNWSQHTILIYSRFTRFYVWIIGFQQSLKFISLSKSTLLYFWRSYTPPFTSEVNIFTEPEPTSELIQRAQKYGIWFLLSGYFVGAFIPFFGEVPLRYGTISYTELPDIPYTETISEIVSGFPIVGDLFILNFITVQSTILYVPISVSIFAMLVGCWNLSYASKHFLKENVGEDGIKQKIIFKIVATLNAPLIMVYVHIVL